MAQPRKPRTLYQEDVFRYAFGVMQSQSATLCRTNRDHRLEESAAITTVHREADSLFFSQLLLGTLFTVKIEYCSALNKELNKEHTVTVILLCGLHELYCCA